MSNEPEPRKIPIYQSLQRHPLFCGCDHRCLYLISFFTVIYVFLGGWIFKTVGVVLCLAGLGIARRMAKADPQFIDIYLRHITYQSYYPANSRYCRGNKKRQGKRYEGGNT